MVRISSLFLVFYLLFETLFCWADIHYVAPDGDDNNPGTFLQPWATVQKAADTVMAGSTVFVRGGLYNEEVAIGVSGSATGGYIVFQNYQGENPVIDGTGLIVPGDGAGLFLIADKSYIVIKGFEIRNYITSTRGVVPAGIHVSGTSHHIELRNNRIHHIETHAPLSGALQGADAHGIAVYGTSVSGSINNIIIDGNELHDLVLGSSEALVLNGNVEAFEVTNNVVRDCNNIAIDCIGFEGTSPDPVYDQARDGNISGNRVYNISSYGNPSYGTEYGAGGIYVDGGKDIVVERNIVTMSDLGIEIASEHSSGATSSITVRSNLIYYNRIAGIAMGGYDDQRGITRDCKVVNNTLYHNDTRMDGNGELWLQFDTRDNIVKNNILYANSQALLISNPYAVNTGNVIDYNLYFSPEGRDKSRWEWKTITYTGFDAYRSGTANDANSLFVDPKFMNVGQPDFHLESSSEAIDAGEDLSYAGPYDIAGNERPQGGGYDLGAYELSPVPPTFYVSLDGACGGNKICYSWIQGAIDWADSIATINISDEVYYENIILDEPKNLVLQGGWDPGFSIKPGYTLINGSMVLSGGKVTLGDIILQ